MQKGIKNEYDFVLFLNNKIVGNLNKDCQDLLYNIFDTIKSTDRLICWKSKFCEKADIKIKINKEIRGLSIKTGKHPSIHQESIKTFYPFLTKIGVDNFIIEKFDKFMKGYLNGNRVKSKDYIESNKEDINTIRNKFNEYYLLLNFIVRFLIQGTEKQHYDCDAIIYGTPRTFMWATKEEIIKYLLNYKTINFNFINISALNIKAYDRNLRNSKKVTIKQDDIQIKWFNIESHFYNIKTLRSIK
ncbi:MAG: hypothetical protein E7163_03820 [Firmicutes bacterium]|nr:hypothetical protein [Bacillota bacterium]